MRNIHLGKNIITTLFVAMSILFCLSGCTSQKKINQQADEILNEYNEGKITYDEAHSTLVKYISESEDSAYIEEQIETLDSLLESKNYYIEANEAYDSGDYENAMSLYKNVSQNDTNYDDANEKLNMAQASYIETIDGIAQAYIDEDKYLEAIKAYENSKTIYDDGETDNKIASVEEQYRKALEEDADSYVQNEDYKSALDKYNELYDYFVDEAYSLKISETEAKYVYDIIEQSESYLKEENYSEAKSVVKTAMLYVEDDSELHTQLERVTMFEPVDLTEKCDREQAGDELSVTDWTSSDTDNYGNDGYTGIKITSSAMTWPDYGDNFANTKYKSTYTLNGDYDTLTGIVAVHEDSSDMYNEAGCAFAIYGDDEILYKYGAEDSDICTEVINGDDKPVYFEVDVSGVSELTIISISSNHDGSNYLTYDSFTYGLLNFTLKKNYVEK